MTGCHVTHGKEQKKAELSAFMQVQPSDQQELEQSSRLFSCTAVGMQNQ